MVDLASAESVSLQVSMNPDGTRKVWLNVDEICVARIGSAKQAHADLIR